MLNTKNTTWTQKNKSSIFLKSEISYIFRSAKKDKAPHSYILAVLKQRVYNNQKFTTLPKYMQSEIKGYIEANFDLMYEKLEFVHWYNGKFVGKELPYGKGFEQNLINDSAHVYKGTEKVY